MEAKHVCEIVSEIAGSPIYGDITGLCRITGKQSTGMDFNKWVKDTFTDYPYLMPGNIISNAAAFCFDERSTILQEKTNRDKPQRFRTYSHIISDGQWYAVTKADKKLIFDLIVSGAEIVSLTETGQKHLFFKHRPGFWQLDEIYIAPNIEIFKDLHTHMCDLMRLGFSQSEVISGEYVQYKIAKTGIDAWHSIESKIKQYRGQPIFSLASWMLFISEEDKTSIQDNMYSKPEPKKKEIIEIKPSLF